MIEELNNYLRVIAHVSPVSSLNERKQSEESSIISISLSYTLSGCIPRGKAGKACKSLRKTVDEATVKYAECTKEHNEL